MDRVLLIQIVVELPYLWFNVLPLILEISQIYYFKYLF